MTDQEAIKWIDVRILELVKERYQASSNKEVTRLNEENNALLRAKDALYKQIPVPPVLTININDKVWRTEIHRCSRCSSILFIQNHIETPDGFKRFPQGYRVKACSVCGQAQKWKEK